MSMNWEDVLENHYKMVQYIVNKFYVPDGLEREDLEQVALLGLWKASQSYRDHFKNKFSTYAYTVMRNEVLMLLRYHEKFAPEYMGGDVLHNVSTDGYVIDKKILSRFFLEGLEPDQRWLVDQLMQGYSQKEIAKMLNSTQPAICRRIRKIKIQALQKWGGEIG